MLAVSHIDRSPAYEVGADGGGVVNLMTPAPLRVDLDELIKR